MRNIITLIEHDYEEDPLQIAIVKHDATLNIHPGETDATYSIYRLTLEIELRVQTGLHIVQLLITLRVSLIWEFYRKNMNVPSLLYTKGKKKTVRTYVRVFSITFYF